MTDPDQGTRKGPKESPDAPNDQEEMLEFEASPSSDSSTHGDASEGGGVEGSASWYIARPGGQPDGPFTLAELKDRLDSGALSRDSLVWEHRLASWVPMGTVIQPSAPATPESPVSFPSAPVKKGGTGVTAPFWPLIRVPMGPGVLMYFGRLCGGVAALILAASLVLLPWGCTWFTGALSLALILVD
jgi:hypothetical protein